MLVSRQLGRFLTKAYEWDDSGFDTLAPQWPLRSKNGKERLHCPTTFAGRASPEGRRHGGTVAPVAVLRRVARAERRSRRVSSRSD
jgi:hypothetical protein